MIEKKISVCSLAIFFGLRPQPSRLEEARTATTRHLQPPHLTGDKLDDAVSDRRAWRIRTAIKDVK